MNEFIKILDNIAFRYSIELNEEESKAFLERMINAKPDFKMQQFMKEAKEYCKKHPIKNYDE